MSGKNEKKNMKEPKILLALDLDGTLVHHHQPLHDDAKQVLEKLHRDGCLLLFATGRTPKWALHCIRLSVPFFLVAYNGAVTYSWPEQEPIRTAFLTKADLKNLEHFIHVHGAVIHEAGGDERVFYTPSRFKKDMLDHLEKRRKTTHERWEAIENIDEIPCTQIASVRFFSFPDQSEKLSFDIQSQTQLSAPSMVDAFDDAYRVIQATGEMASKGQALLAIREENPLLYVIAAGNDVNDIDMLKRADYSIAVDDAALNVREVAHVITPAEHILDMLEQKVRQAKERL